MTDHLVAHLRPFGTTSFASMSALAAEKGAINLGQGFPDTDGPTEVLEAAVRAIRAGHNQYPPGRGIAALREAIAEHQRHWYGLSYDPATQVLVTAGATEALTAAILALCDTGDEVVVLEPTYDSYTAAIAMARAVPRPVRLRHPSDTEPGYRLDEADLRAAISDRTRLLLINTPHNPTGHVLGPAELDAVARVAVEHDLLVITDEVYEHLAFGGAPYVPLATLPGMAERTVQISSAGKTFSTTGWKIGWVCSTPELVTAVTTAKQFLTYVSGGPFQWAIAEGLALPDERFAAMAPALADQRDILVPGLVAAGMTVHPTEGTYFVTADVAPLGYDDAVDFCWRLPDLRGVVAVPSSVFYSDPAGARSLVRFAFCKRPALLAEAAERLATLGR
ncbi:pyridoxal phosphate-dependent aminotransferase [Raineyella fluvialis]|uniref:Pyridoxal phosphate-dependent aminotransferase n=1 Tax=Raineyella fluvialis TaxID=2662261 RepID=A0A5Q2FFG6_9ACTN|nr:pyridoxal phosphate-dependent aminotransferase [Raineyella fluvialis]QGF24527.1 pyridoxal phosphate-dependent aminotransferase [Raineyella fluvialis]